MRGNNAVAIQDREEQIQYRLSQDSLILAMAHNHHDLKAWLTAESLRVPIIDLLVYRSRSTGLPAIRSI